MEEIMEKDKNLLIGDNTKGRDENGRWLPGTVTNPLGRPSDKLRIDTESLLESLKTVEKAKQKPFLQHCWERAYRSDGVLKTLLDKFIANKGIDINQLTGGGQYVVNIQYFGDRKPADTAAESAKTIDIQGIDDDKGR